MNKKCCPCQPICSDYSSAAWAEMGLRPAPVPEAQEVRAVLREMIPCDSYGNCQKDSSDQKEKNHDRGKKGETEAHSA